jgi:chromate transporter
MARPSFKTLSWIFLRYGNFTFGGGTATIAVIDRELIERHQLIRRDQAALSFALARLTPGTNLLAYCTGTGWLARGLPGAIAALIASSLPCSLAVVLVTVLYDWSIRKPLVATAMHGAIAAAVSVMLATGWTIVRPYRATLSRKRLGLLLGSSCALAAWRVSPLTILLAAASIGFFFPEEQGRP